MNVRIVSGKHEELLHHSAVRAYAQLIKLQENAQSEDRDSKQPADENDYGAKRSSSSRLRRISANDRKSDRESTLGQYSHEAGDGDGDDVAETEGIGAKRSASAPSRGKIGGLFPRSWFGAKTGVADPEAGDELKPKIKTQDDESDPDVSFFRLAALNRPEAHILVLGSVASIGHGLVFPLYALLLSTVLRIFFEPAEQLKKDANFWAVIFLVLGIGSLFVLTAEMLCFAVGGGRLVERVRSLTFEKVLQQEPAWFDDTRNSRSDSLV
jgi:hypothetical protein